MSINRANFPTLESFFGRLLFPMPMNTLPCLIHFFTPHPPYCSNATDHLLYQLIQEK